MILTKNEIIKKINEGVIKIEPLDMSAIGPASIDLALGKKIKIFNHSNKIIIDIEKEIDYAQFTKEIDITNGYILKPRELILGITEEKITLPENICGWLQSRSRFARIGLMSHITAPFICPGISNHQVLEIFHSGHHKIKLMPGVKICQLILEKCEGNAKYEGKFKYQ